MSNIGNYYAIHNSVAANFPEGSTELEWINALHTLQAQAVMYQREARSNAELLNTLHSKMTTDVSLFATFVKDLNSAVNGDNGVLESIDGKLDILQGEIDGAIAAVSVSGLSIIGGILMICVGSITDIITAGTTTPLIVGGIGMFVGGGGGGSGDEIESAISLAKHIDSKASLLTK